VGICSDRGTIQRVGSRRQCGNFFFGVPSPPPIIKHPGKKRHKQVKVQLPQKKCKITGAQSEKREGRKKKKIKKKKKKKREKIKRPCTGSP
jgi:hypothetical protein